MHALGVMGERCMYTQSVQLSAISRQLNAYIQKLVAILKVSLLAV
jgi:hypothetical protein